MAATASAPAAAKLLCVFSTLAAPVRYVDWKDAGNGVPVEGDSVVIKGGAGVANSNLITPLGVPTMVTQAQADMLQKNPVFKLHQDNGYVVLQSVDRPPSEDVVEKAVAGMEGRDNSAPLVDADFTANGMAAPTVGSVSPSA